MKRRFEIEWPDDCGPLWMNTSNLLLCLTAVCTNTRFSVRDVTGDGEANIATETSGPQGANRKHRRPLTPWCVMFVAVAAAIVCFLPAFLMKWLR